MWRDDSSLEGGGAVQPDAHALAASEDLTGNRRDELRLVASREEGCFKTNKKRDDLFFCLFCILKRKSK